MITSGASNNIKQRSGRGSFILLEGVDRCGKTTQCGLLVKHLMTTLSLAVVAMRFPDRSTEIGSIINAYLTRGKEVDDHAIHLLFSANRWEAASTLAQHLSDGTTVICDRYAYSGVAFTSAKQKANLSLDWCKAPDQGLPAPDAVIFLDLSPEQAQKRGGYVKLDFLFVCHFMLASYATFCIGTNILARFLGNHNIFSLFDELQFYYIIKKNINYYFQFSLI